MLQLKAVREAKGLSQEKLAYLAEVSVRTVRRTEMLGRANSNTLVKFARVLECSLDDLYERAS